MKSLNKIDYASLIQAAKPASQPDKVFVDQLAQRVQQRAMVLAKQPVAVPRKTVWWLWSTVSLGTATAIIAAVVVFSPTTHLTGYIQKGPFISGSNITVQELNNALQPTGKIYQITTTNDFGEYSLNQKIRSKYVEIIASGYYYDEVSGTISAAPLSLHAIASVTDGGAINVNILTSLAAPRLRYLVNTEAKTFIAAKQQAEQEVLHVFQIDTAQLNDFESMNISKGGEANAALLAISVMLQGKQSVGEISELLAKLSLDLEADGAISDESMLLKTLQTNTTALNTFAIGQHLQDRFAVLGVTATVPDFEKFIKPFTTSTDPFGYQITLLNNTFSENHTPNAKIELTIHGSQFEPDQEVVTLKNLFPATQVTYIDEETLQAEFLIAQLTPGSYTVLVRNQNTGRTGVTDGEPIEAEPTGTPERRLIIQGMTPQIDTVLPVAVSYLNGGTITITGEHFSYGTFVWLNGWEVPSAAIRVINDQRIDVDLSSALITNNAALPRQQSLTITIQTPDFQKADYTGFKIQ